MTAPNVLVVVVDALRADRVETSESDSLTPNIASLVSSGEYFESCYSCADKTTACVTSIQTGLHPKRHGVLHHGKSVRPGEIEYVSGTKSIQESLSETHTTIGCELQGSWIKRGFDHWFPESQKSPLISLGSQILSPLPNTISGPVKRLYYRLPSFDRTLREQGSPKFGENRPERHRAEWFTDRFLAATADANGPWFGFLHYYDTHMEYTSPPEYLESHVISDREYKDEDTSIEELYENVPHETTRRLTKYSDMQTVGDLKRRYDAAIRYVDEQIGRLVDELRERETLSDTVIILTADHGESLTEHGILFSHSELYDETWHVPLVIDAPGFDGVESRFVQHFDIVPTVLDLLDREYSLSQLDGQSLVPDESGERDLAREAVIAEQTHDARQQVIRTAEYKYIRNLHEERVGRWSHIERPDEQLYDLKHDPAEQSNVAPSSPDVCSRLDAKLDERLERIPTPEKHDPEYVLPEDDEDLMETLDALGYKFD